MAFKTVFQGSFCNKSGDDVIVQFQRDFIGGEEIIPQEIIFAGEDNEPVIIEYSEDGNNKDNPINKSQCTVNIKAVEGFELSSLYTENDNYWRIVISGAWNWIGWMLPDNSSEPYENKPYDVSVQATDALGTLDDLPFQNADLTKIKGSFSDHDILRIALNKTGLQIPLLIGVSTYETQMTVGVCPMKQSFIQAQTFIDSDQSSFACSEVIRSILARYGCRLSQFNGKWQIVNVLEYSRGTVYAWEFDINGNQTATYPNIVNTLATGNFTRENIPTNATSSFAKAYLSSTAYYQFGYPPNSLINGNMDTWSLKPAGLPDGWFVVQTTGTITATTKIRQSAGVDTTDYYISAYGGGNGYVKNANEVQIRANQIAGISMDLLLPTDGVLVLSPIYFSVIVQDDTGKYYTNAGWQSAYGTYTVRFDSARDITINQATVNFNLGAQKNDFKITVAFLVAGRADGTHYETYVNNVTVSANTDGASKAAIGSYNKQTQTSNQTFQPDPILILNSDDDSTQRLSPILVNGLPTSTWTRAGITESVSLLHTIANSQLRLHARPYKIFEGDFIGYGDINPNSLITIDLNPGSFIFMSGTFNLRTDVHTLRWAEALIDEPTYIEVQKLDYGTETDKNGISVGTPQGVGDQPGSSYIDLSGYAKLTDVPAAASNVETQAGTVANKYVSPSTLANWWAYVRGLAFTITGIWSVPNAAAGTSTQQIASTKFVMDAITLINPNYREVNANYTLLSTDNTVNVTANSPTLTLPTAVGIAGRIIRIKNSGTGTVTINTTGSQLIDGTLTKVINTQYSLFGLQSTGANWIIIAQM